MSREERIHDLKSRMVAKYGSCLIPLPEDIAVCPVEKKDDTPEEREAKRVLKQQIQEAREAAYKQKVPEMLVELDKIIARIKHARPEQQKAGVEGIHSTSVAALSLLSVYCDQCGNRDPNNVITDGRRGDRICAGKDGRGCGAVLQDHIEVQGADKRNFEGEEDKRQFGPAPNKLLGDAANMETALNIEARGTGRDNSAWKRIQQAQQSVEMNLSSVGKEEKHTREGYKTGHKRKAFGQLEVIANDLNIHTLVVQRAKEEFARYRDAMEAVHNFEGVLLACLMLAFEETTAAGGGTYEKIKPKFVSLEESTPADAKSFGHVRPRAEVTEDVAICSVPQLPIGKFTLDQVKEWLLAVAEGGSNSGSSGSSGGGGGRGAGAGGSESVGYRDEALKVYAEIERLASAPDATESTDKAARNKREIPQDGMFGTVTKLGRLKRYQSTSAASSNGKEHGNGHSHPGMHLLRVQNITAALSARTPYSTASNPSAAAGSAGNASSERARQAEVLLREAVIRRSKYDIALADYESQVALQQTRLRTEEHVSTNMQAAVLMQPRKPTTAGGGRDAAGAGGGSDEPQTKRARVEVAATNVPTATAAPARQQAAQPPKPAPQPVQEAVEDFEFDLEELVGGPIASAATSRFASMPSRNNSSNSGGASSGAVRATSNGGAVQNNVERPAGMAGATGGASQSSTSTAAGSGGDGSGSGAPAATASAAAAGANNGAAKKVGMKPRPKIVIS